MRNLTGIGIFRGDSSKLGEKLNNFIDISRRYIRVFDTLDWLKYQNGRVCTPFMDAPSRCTIVHAISR